MRRKFFIVASVLFVLLFVLFPDISSKGAENGLLLWFNVIIPSLCPFMIISTMLIKLDVTSCISNMFYPMFHKVFKLSKNGCYPAITGMLSGYPLGAKTVADMYKTGAFSKSEAQYIISFCNNASPMFMLEYTGIKCLGLKQPAIMLVIIYMSAFINAFFERNKMEGAVNNKPGSGGLRKRYPLIEALDESILSSAITLVKVGGYIILFSIFTGILQNFVISSEIIKIAGAGILEITTGCKVLADTGLPLYIKCILASAFCAFGGLSSVAQTSSTLIGTGLSNRKYVFAKFRQSVIAALLAAVTFKFIL